ncbi:MAG: fatty acid--CoA ligase family protein, partial [Gemmatimonadota bacterium]
AAVTMETHRGIDYLQLFEELLAELPELRYLVTVGEEDLWHDDRIFQFEDLLSAGGGRDFAAPEIDAEADLFAILYTSGTTGKPKGVELTHANLLETAAATSQGIGMTENDRVIGVSSLFHVFGIGPGVLGTLLSGASLVLQDDFDQATTLDLIERHRVTVHHGVPTAFVFELHENRRRPRDLSSLRTGIVAGAPVGDDFLIEVRREICPRLHVAYSLTETASTVSMTHPEDPREKQRFTVGRPLPNTTIRVLEKDGSELPVESLGEIAVKGPGVMRGYYRQPVETSRSFDPDGFLLTGDLGIIDDDGYVHLVGRRKEVIIRGGFNVYPREVEDRLHAHPAVREAAVVGIPDELLGEAICAGLVPVEGAIVTGDEIKNWCRVTLADYKIPDLVRFFDTFPRTGSGKVRRVELVRMIRAEELNRRK